MIRERKRRNPEQIVKLLQEGHAMAAEAALDKRILKTALEENY